MEGPFKPGQLVRVNLAGLQVAAANSMIGLLRKQS